MTDRTAGTLPNYPTAHVSHPNLSPGAPSIPASEQWRSKLSRAVSSAHRTASRGTLLTVDVPNVERDHHPFFPIVDLEFARKALLSCHGRWRGGAAQLGVERLRTRAGDCDQRLVRRCCVTSVEGIVQERHSLVKKTWIRGGPETGPSESTRLVLEPTSSGARRSENRGIETRRRAGQVGTKRESRLRGYDG